ncbi:glycosyltransferase [Candidatus Thioglobus sp.]|nr:glycosyltransferase [Candidatus Thioglobus sp.]
MNNLAPIVLFVYNRPWHTKQTIESLQKNELASQSEIFIYCDNAKSEKVQSSVNEVRNFVDTVDGFKKVTVIKREKNWGLSASITDGVTKIVNKYGKIIVLEDDLVVSPYFLKFMNDALKFYKEEKKVWHISGWNYPVEIDGLDDVFLWRLMNCWGWATWADRWQYYERNTDKIMKKFSKKDKDRFNFYGAEDFFGQIVANHKKKKNTWAVFWYAIIFKKNGLCLNPAQTFVENIGNDNSGVNCGETNIFKSNLSSLQKTRFTCQLIESAIAVENLKVFYNQSQKTIFKRIINRLKRIVI